MAYSDTASATEWAVARNQEQAKAHSGEWLRERAQDICGHLPPGPLTVLTTSPEGAALAGAITVLRADPTRWRTIGFGRQVAVEGPAVVIEAVQLGEGLRASLSRLLPGVSVIDASTAATATAIRAAA